jgi:Ca-activated chloride channel homolog
MKKTTSIPFRSTAVSVALALICSCQRAPERAAADAQRIAEAQGTAVQGADAQSTAAQTSSAEGAASTATSLTAEPSRDDGAPLPTRAVPARKSGSSADVKKGSPAVAPEAMLAPVASAPSEALELAAPPPAAAGRMGSLGGGVLARSKVARQAPPAEPDAEAYAATADTGFARVADSPLSTFSIDVDTASYSNVRRFLQGGQLPPPGAVRVEELINYFPYAYSEPSGEAPFGVTTEVSVAPWNPDHRLLHVGLQAKRLDTSQLPAKNLVFLLDVSGSMESPNKLPLLKRSLGTLTETLGARDRVAIVVYAGASGLVLPPTAGDDKGAILSALERLEAGGSTNGGEGIELAYELAQQLASPGATTRVVLATDGDFNVGATSEDALMRLIVAKRKSGVYLSVLGFGMGNLKDSTLELLADKGNGNYAYVDSLAEARKVLVEEAGATLVTLAQDVKLQLEFNPDEVGAYRLIGYENRRLEDRDFNDDQKDAGELGAGHSVTALYELVPPGGATGGSVDALRYQAPARRVAGHAGELCTIKLRYKRPGSDRSQVFERPVSDASVPLAQTSQAFRFSAAVATFGMTLRASPERGRSSYALARELAQGALGRDPHGYQHEFIGLVDSAAALDRPSPSRPLAMP